MNKIGLLLLPVLALFALPLGSFAQEVDPSEAFLKAYMTAQQAEKLERENQFKPALAKFRFAGSMLEELKKNNGDWQPAIVEYPQPQNRRGDPAGPEQDRNADRPGRDRSTGADRNRGSRPA